MDEQTIFILGAVTATIVLLAAVYYFTPVSEKTAVILTDVKIQLLTKIQLLAKLQLLRSLFLAARPVCNGFVPIRQNTKE